MIVDSVGYIIDEAPIIYQEAFLCFDEIEEHIEASCNHCIDMDRIQQTLDNSPL